MKRDFLRAFVLVMGFLLLMAEVDRQDQQPVIAEFQQ